MKCPLGKFLSVIIGTRHRYLLSFSNLFFQQVVLRLSPIKTRCWDVEVNWIGRCSVLLLVSGRQSFNSHIRNKVKCDECQEENGCSKGIEPSFDHLGRCQDRRASDEETFKLRL